jgi:hypothetical protein
MVIRHILQYLLDHPDARDTMQGILRWWLPRDSAACGEAEVQAALEVLVARGWLTRRPTTSSQELYGVNKDKLEEIKGFLREPESEAEEQRE